MFSFGKKIKEVEENFERLAKVLDALDLPVWQRDESLNIIFCNNIDRNNPLVRLQW